MSCKAINWTYWEEYSPKSNKMLGSGRALFFDQDDKTPHTDEVLLDVSNSGLVGSFSCFSSQPIP